MLTLRKLAAVRGLVLDQVRTRAWPHLLGVDASAAAASAARLAQHADAPHRDRATVRCDVERSLWHFTAGWSDERRNAKREALERILNGAARGAVSLCQALRAARAAPLLCAACPRLSDGAPRAGNNVRASA